VTAREDRATQLRNAITRSNERDVYLGRILEAERRGNERAAELADQVGGRMVPEQPTDIEQERHGPGGRAHAGDPRPGDFTGKDQDQVTYEREAAARRDSWDRAAADHQAQQEPHGDREREAG
jgi:hypothetical protein